MDKNRKDQEDGQPEEHFADDDERGSTQKRSIEEVADTMRDMIEYIARNLSDNKDAVSVTIKHERGSVMLYLEVDEEDKGRIIGRNGRIAESMRALLRVAAIKAGIRARLEIT